MLPLFAVSLKLQRSGSTFVLFQFSLLRVLVIGRAHSGS